jgi:hypothetical protein
VPKSEQLFNIEKENSEISSVKVLFVRDTRDVGDVTHLWPWLWAGTFCFFKEGESLFSLLLCPTGCCSVITGGSFPSIKQPEYEAVHLLQLVLILRIHGTLPLHCHVFSHGVELRHMDKCAVKHKLTSYSPS